MEEINVEDHILW